MSLLRRLFGRAEDETYAQGIALYEQGRFGEAVELLRGAAGEGSAPSRSLGAFYLRQALVAEGRRLLRADRAAKAVVPLAEAASTWDQFPDLQFLLGAAKGLSGDWDGALAAAGAALRRNPDYAEAHLLRAAALAARGQARAAGVALDALVETGRRREHPLVAELARPEGWRGAAPPDDLAARLRALVTTGDPKQEVAEAVALCRAGRWDEGIAALHGLVERFPRYPDLRVRLAAALHQRGELAEAAAQVDAALALNERYRAGLHLKAIVQAERGDFAGSLGILRRAPEATAVGERQAEADLLACYLEAALELLTGRPGTAEAILAPRGDLTSAFPRAQLLRAAAADLRDRPEVADRLLSDLAEAWPAEPEYRAYHVGHLLRRGELGEAERILARWPAGAGPDERPLLLAARLALAHREPPRLPAAAGLASAGDGEPEAAPNGGAVPATAWRLAAAEAAALRGEWETAAVAVGDLWAAGLRTEGTARPLALCRARVAWPDPSAPAPEPPAVVPVSVLPAAIWSLHRAAGGPETADDLLRRHQAVHPEEPRWVWLRAGFWLEPIRRWIG